MSLEVRGLTVVHAGRTVLHPVDLDVRTGTTLTVLGASGAGKTTLLRAIAGLEPTRGAVRWQGEDLAALPTHRRGIGLVFHE
ncbi:MAG: ATP-binding cassette domain-containing protein, partial [Actinomycetes bacterium]